MENICKKCKYFKRYEITQYGECTSGKIVSDITAPIERKHDDLRYSSDDDYGLDASVGENFGCIHFIKKEKIDGK